MYLPGKLQRLSDRDEMGADPDVCGADPAYVFDTGILAIVMPSVIWLVTSVTYCRACLQNKGEKLSK